MTKLNNNNGQIELLTIYKNPQTHSIYRYCVKYHRADGSSGTEQFKTEEEAEEFIKNEKIKRAIANLGALGVNPVHVAKMSDADLLKIDAMDDTDDVISFANHFDR